MKNLCNYITVAFSIALLGACESDLDKAYYNESGAKPAVLEELPTSYVIDNLKQDETALTFKWSAPEVGYSASITNSLEMDVEGEANFDAKKITLSSSKEKTTEVSFTNKELNDQVLALLENYADEDGTIRIEPTVVQFRLVSSISEQKSSLISNVLTMTVTPYDNGNAGYSAPQLLPLNFNELVLDGGKKNETALTLNWQAAYMGDNASVTYHIEMDKAGQSMLRGLLGKVEIISVKDETMVNLTHQELNDALIALQAKYGESVATTEVELKVVATINNYPVAQVSNVISLSLTPYVSSPELTLPEEMDLTSTDVYTLSWQAVDGAKYQVEMDINGKDFSQKAVLCSGIETTEFEIDSEKLNQQIKYLLLAENVTNLSSSQEIIFRVKAYYDAPESAVISTSKMSIVTWEDVSIQPDCVYVVGEFGNWSWSSSEKLYSVHDDEVYSGLIVSDRLKEGWKITKNQNWDQNWGAPINNGILTMNNGSNITIYGDNNNTSYWVEFNQNTGLLTMTNEEKSWMLLGDYNNYSYGDDSKMGIVYDEQAGIWCLKKADVEMQAGDEWYICSQILNQKITPETIQGHYEASMEHEDYFTVSETGVYDILWYFNEAIPYLLVIKK